MGATKQRALLAMLGLRPGQAVTTDQLIEGLWGEDPPLAARRELPEPPLVGPLARPDLGPLTGVPAYLDFAVKRTGWSGLQSPVALFGRTMVPEALPLDDTVIVTRSEPMFGSL